MIKRNPEYNLEVTLAAAVNAFKSDNDVLLCFEDEEGVVYAAQLISKKHDALSQLRDIPFEQMADAKYYIKGDNDEKTD